jgi:hypothetical protein
VEGTVFLFEMFSEVFFCNESLNMRGWGGADIGGNGFFYFKYFERFLFVKKR